MSLFSRAPKEPPIVPDTAELPLPALPNVWLENPPSIGDDYNLVELVRSLAKRKVELLTKRHSKLKTELSNIELELDEAKAILATVEKF